MTFASSRAVILALLAAGAAAAQEPVPSPAPPPTFTAGVEMVVVDVVVTAGRGAPMPGLRREDFTVTEDGVPQEIQTFDAVDAIPGADEEDAPAAPPRVSLNTGPQAMNARSFVLVFDQDHLSPLGAIRAKAAISRFLEFGPRPGDTVMIAGTGGGSWWVTRAGEAKAEVGALLKGLQGRYTAHDTPDRITDWEALRIWGEKDVIVQEQVRRRMETYATGRQRMAEGLPVRGADRITDAGGAGGKELVTSEEILARAQEVYHLSLVRNRTTLLSLGRILDSMGAVRGRKTLVLFSEGFVHDTRLSEHDAVLRTAQRSNVAMYFVDVRGLEAMPAAATAQFGTLPPGADIAESVTQGLAASGGADDLAIRTGGFSVKNTNDLERGMLRVAQEARHYYLLGYVPANRRADGRWRKIGVKVARPDVEVRARQGYFEPGGRKGAQRTAGAWRPGLQQAVDSPYEFQGIPLRLTHHVFGESAPGKARTLLTAEVDVRALALEESKGRAVDTLETLLVVVHRDTGAAQRQDEKVELQLPPDVRAVLETRGLAVNRELELPPGAHQAKLVVRGKKSGVIGSIRHDFEVPDLRAWRTSTPVLSDTLAPKADGEPMRPVVAARRTFAPGATLYYQFEVYGSGKDAGTGLPRVSAGFTLRGPDGRPVTRGQPAPIKPTPEGRLARLGRVPLEGAPSGRYELVLDLRDEVTGREMEVREPFSVEPPAAAPRASDVR
jgi:VWFA-related protein